MKIANPTGKTLEELQNSLSVLYSGTKINKPFFGLLPNNLIVPAGNFKHIIRPVKKNTMLVTDFVPPVFITVLAIVLGLIGCFVMAFIVFALGGRFTVGGVLWVILILLLLKYIYKSNNKEKFDKFHTDLNTALTQSSQPGSIF